MVTPEQLKAILKKHRWTIAVSTSGKQQVYAAKQRQGKKLATLYVGTSNTLNSLSENDVEAKITRKEERLAKKRDSHDQARPEQEVPNDRSYMPVFTIIPTFTPQHQQRKEA